MASIFNGIVLLVAITTLHTTEASHKRAGIIMWKPVNPSNVGFPMEIEVSYRVAWRRSSGVHFCDADIISDRNLITEGSIGCSTGNACLPASFPLSYRCTDFDSQGDWTTGANDVRFVVNSNLDFFIQYTGCCWISSLVVGANDNWSVRTRVNLVPRANGLINSSPQATLSPIVRVVQGCARKFKIATRDPDRDVVRCRNGVNSLECGGSNCNTFSAIATLSSNCEMMINANAVGLYRATLILEDFVDATSQDALSSIPLQFIIDVFDSGQSCDSLPDFIPDTPLENQCVAFIATEAGQEKSFTVSAKAGPQDDGSPDLVTSFTTSSPVGVQRQGAIVQTVVDGMSIAQLTFKWTPTLAQVGDHIFCVTAVSANRIPSNQRCFVLNVFTTLPDPPTLTGTEPTAALCGITSAQLETFKFNFNEPIFKPQGSAFIRFFEIGVATAVLEIDTSQLGDDAFVGNMLTVIIPDNTLLPGRGYYVTLDGGAISGAAGCASLSTAVTDDTTIRFFVDLPCGSKPIFVPDTPLENQCIPFLATEAGSSKSFTVFAKAGSQNGGPPDLVTSFTTSALPAGVVIPSVIVQTVVDDMSIAELTFTWAPTLAQLGDHQFCITVVSAANFESDERCFTLNVFTVELDVLRLTGTEPDTLCDVKLANLNSFKFNFNTAILKPQIPAFISFFEIGVEAAILEFDASQLEDDAFVGNMLTVAIPGGTFKSGRSYYVTLDSGVATGTIGCGSLSLAVTNNATLRFYVDRCYGTPYKMYPDCTNCEKYMWCVSQNHAVSMPCPYGTRFDADLGMCNHKGQTPCIQGPVSTDPCAFVDNGGIIKDPDECPKYIVCEHGVSHPKECDPGTIYSVISNVCEHSETPSCPNGVDRR